MMFRRSFTFVSSTSIKNVGLKKRYYSSSTNKDLTLVILEGDPIMSQKQKVFQRLSKMGYTTKNFSHFLDFCYEKNKEHQQGQQNQQQEAQQEVGEIELEDFIPDFVQEVHKYAEETFQKFRVDRSVKHKNNHIFIDASPLTPYPYLNSEAQSTLVEYLKESMFNIKSQYPCKVYVCEADVYESKFRLGGHKYMLEQDMGEEQYNERFRSHFAGGKQMLSEEEIVDYMHAKYNELNEEKWWFDNVLITTDTQQATCTLLEKYLDLQFKLPPFPPAKDN